MPISDGDVVRLGADYPGIAIVAKRPRVRRSIFRRLFSEFSANADEDDIVVAVRVVVSGIRGGGSKRPQKYEVVIDVSDLTARLPTIWVTAPEDAKILHRNIWKSTHRDGWCPWLDVSLPHLCWFTFEQVWSAAPSNTRTLGSALEFAKQLLNSENDDSPAR